jgi:hypothetical protein
MTRGPCMSHRRPVLVIFLLVLGASPARAIMTPTSSVLGWTKDSTALVWTLGFDSPETWTVASAYGAKPLVLSRREDYDAFVAKHPLAEDGASGPTAPGGKTRVTVDGGSIEDDVVRIAARSGKVTLERAKDRALGEVFDQPGLVSVFWSPDGRRVALFYEERESCKPTGTGDFACNDPRREVLMLPVAGPRVQLLGKSLAPEVFDGVARALDGAGFAVTGQDMAQVARDKTVVYAPKALADAARAIAAAVPGGATVDVLSWKTRFDVVVALGASAK